MLPSLAVALTLLLSSCSREPTPPAFAESQLPPEEVLRQRIDDMVAHVKETRHLRAREDSAWQIVHGVLAYERQYMIELDGELVPAMQWLLDGARLPEGGHLNGWRLEPADRGIRAILEPGSMTGQGHPDQWLGYLSQAGLRLDESLMVAGKKHEVSDLLEQAKWDIQPGTEATWTLMALVSYLPLDAKWTSRDGTEWTMEKLVAREADAEVNGAACGGCHRLYALSIAVNRYMEEQGITEEQLEQRHAEQPNGWTKANSRVLDAIKTARQFQQPDGSFSTGFFARAGTSQELEKQIGSTGHILEVLSVSLTDQQLREPWVTAAAARLVELLDATRDVSMNAGSLYHAAHSLQLYRGRRFGPVEADPAIVTQAKAGSDTQTN
jgi:hypothetical protein